MGANDSCAHETVLFAGFGGFVIIFFPKISVGTEKPREEKTTTPTSNDTGNKEPVKEPSSAAHVMTQPGILAGRTEYRNDASIFRVLLMM